MPHLRSCIHAPILRVWSWFLTIKLQRIPSKSFFFVLLLAASIVAPAQSKVATTTALALTTSSGTVSTVPLGTVVTLTATVSPAAGTIGAGQVKFCDALANYCTDIHVLGTAQLTSAGTATLKLRPGLGTHSYKAVFLGTNNYGGSFSSASTLTVTGTIGPLASTTTIAETGSWGSYALTGTVTELGNTAAPTGTVSFLDSNNGNAVLGKGSLGTAIAGLGWLSKQSSWMSSGISGVVADFNGDGIPDIAEDNGQINILLGNGDGSFNLSSTNVTQAYAAGASIAVGDFNNDDILDLVVISPSGTATVYLGKGDGTFTQVTTQPNVGTQASGIAVADFNGDGNLDLASVTVNSTITILLGNGDGTFTAASQSPSAGSGAYAIVAGDFNGDGKTDLAVTAQQTDSLTILLGNGDGTFTAAPSPLVTSYANAIAEADFNGDGKLDLIVACENEGLVVVLLGNGDGTFTAAPSFPAAVSDPTAIVVGDFNQDGIPDVGLLNNTYTTGGPLEFLGKGDGTFLQVPGLPEMSVYSGFLVGGDFNGDGRTDLAIAGSGSGSQNLVVYLTEPTETAIASANISVVGVGQHLVDAGYAGDGNYNSSVSSTIPLWGVPPATTTTLTVASAGVPVTTVAPGSVVILTATVATGASPVTAGQVNFCDAAAASCTDIHLLGRAQLSSSGTAAFKFVPGPGQHSYKAVFVEGGWGMSSASNVATLTVGPAPKPVYTDTTSLTWGGYPGNYSLTATLEGFGGTAMPTGNLSFLDTSFGNAVLSKATLGSATPGTGWVISQTPAFGSNPVYPISEAVGDFNGDGIPDLAVIWSSSYYGGPYSITILFGNGDGTFTTGPTMQPVGFHSYPYMIAGDFNGDGKPDLAILSSSIGGSSIGYLTILLNTGGGTFAVQQTTVAFNLPNSGGDFIPGAMTAADFNGDGKLDLAIVGDYVSSGGVVVLLGNGDGTFPQAQGSFLSNHGFGLIATGDFNGDGIPDLVATNYFGPGGATIFLGKGDGTFTATGAPLVTDSFLKSAVVGDFNGDGVLDLALGGNSAVEVFLGKGDGTFTQATGSPISGGGMSLVAGDFNHDGKLDLAGLDNYNDQVDIFVGAGDGTFAEAVTTPNVSQQWLGPFAIVAADFNGDGVPDLGMLTQNVNTASILLTEPTQTVTVTANGVVPLGAGTHNVEASYSGDPNYSPSVSSTVALTAGLAPLVVTPAAGAYSSVQTVTITESVPGATIYYSASGIVNTNGFVPYTGPISLAYGGYETIQAYATETGYQQTNYVTAFFSLVLPPTATPTISLSAGYYSGPQNVTITDSDTTAQIYYTTNGTYPNANSNLYSGPITVSSSETLVAIATSSAHSYSQAVSAQYVIGTSSVAMIYSVAGAGIPGYAGDGGPATLAQLDYPWAVVKDASGNLYISDTDSHMVRKVAAGTGIITVVAGNGYNGYRGDGGPATNAELSYPGALALDKAGNLLIGDSGNSTVRKVNLSSGVITTYAGSPTATSQVVALNSVTGIALDSSNNLYIASGSTISQVNSATGIITTIAGTGGYGYSGDGGPAINALFRSVYGMAFDAGGNLYLADEGNNLVRKISAMNGVISPTSIISTVAGTIPQNGSPVPGFSGDGGPATSAKLNYPVAVALDSSGNLFISDFNNNEIREVTASNGVISTVAGNGSFCDKLGGDGGPATGASLCFPEGIAVDSGGNLLIADESNRIREVVPAAAPPTVQTATPTFSLPAGNFANPQSVTISDTTPGASIYFTVDGTTPTTGSASGYSLPIDITGAVTIKAVASAPGYLTSAPASATYTVSAFAPVITTVAGNGNSGFYGAGGPALSVEFGGPKGLAIDKAGNLYVADSFNNVIWMISAATGTASIFAGSGSRGGYTGDGGPATSATLNSPQGLALDSVGNLYVADEFNNAIRKITASTGIISTVAGRGPGMVGNLGDGGFATSAFLQDPMAIAFDSAGNLYIADAFDFRVREVSAATGIITTVAGNGNPTYSGDGGAATSAGLQFPDSLAVDAAGNIYVASSNGGRVRRVTATSGQIDSIAGFEDLTGDTGDGGPATSAEVAPRALALDSAGNLYISNVPGEIREINAATGVISKVAGIGYPGYSGDGGAAAVAQISYPTQVAFDGAGNLYFADAMYRIRKVTFAAQTAATPVFSVASGTYTTPQSVTITDATPDSTIYYTTDGSTPGASSSVYSTAIAVNSSETINAIAVAVDYNQSAVATATYVVNLPAPAPSISSLSPAYTSAGSAQFTLTVNGSGFTNGSTMYWGTSALTTQYVSSTQLTATVAAANVAAAGVASITVQTPVPGGGTSNTLQFEIDTASSITPPSFPTSTVTVTAGGTASYPVRLPSSATNVSIKCLNLPAGAACSYSAATGALTITTSSSTPTGTYVITAVFTETLPGAAAAVILLPFLLAPFARMSRRNHKNIWLLAIIGVLTVVAIVIGCGGGGSNRNSGEGSNPSPATHQVTSSSTITLIVK